MKHECTRYLELDEIRESLELRTSQHTNLREDDVVWIHTPRVTMTWPQGRQVAHCRVARVIHHWPRRDQFESIIELKDWQDLTSDQALTWLDQMVEAPLERAKRLP